MTSLTDALGFTPTQIMGIDPSLASTGVYTDKPVTIKTKKGEPRMVKLCNAISDEIHRSCPDFAVIESLPANAMSAGLTGQAQGVVRYALQVYGVPYLELAPSSVKKLFAGNGRATKEDMIERAKLMGVEVKNSDEADAYAMAWCGYFLTGPADHPAPKGGWKING